VNTRQVHEGTFVDVYHNVGERFGPAVDCPYPIDTWRIEWPSQIFNLGFALALVVLEVCCLWYRYDYPGLVCLDSKAHL
jgi:hypothetical protein